MKAKQLSRRHFLHGLGGSILHLPLLEAMLPNFCYGQSVEPLRMVNLYFRYGIHTNTWTPSGTGSSYALPALLAPALNPFKNELIMIRRLRNHNGFDNGDGPGDHAREVGTFLTCTRINKSQTDIKAGISADQIVAKHLGDRTARRSLVLNTGAEGEDSGYSGIYQTNLSWLSDRTPAPGVSEPRNLFNDLFSVAGTSTNTEALKIKKYKLSILDGAIQESNRLISQLGSHDRQKMDEYLTSVREVERRITQGTQAGASCSLGVQPGTNYEFDDKVRVMLDLITLAMQCDLSRVVTYIMHSGSFSFINAAGNHHSISHYPDDASYPDKLKAINVWYAEQFAYFLNKLMATTSGSSSLLQNSMIVFGGGLADSNSHDHGNLPIILAGRAGGSWQVGRCLDTGSNIPLANLHTTIIKKMGVTDAMLAADGFAGGVFADATGIVAL